MNFQGAIDGMIAGHQQIIASLLLLRDIQPVADQGDGEEFDPSDHAKNKFHVGGLDKLTPRGVEICYRLFDAGKTRNAVCTLMEISFGAANHRYNAWLKLGGAGRTKQPLN